MLEVMTPTAEELAEIPDQVLEQMDQLLCNSYALDPEVMHRITVMTAHVLHRLVITRYLQCSNGQELRLQSGSVRFTGLGEHGVMEFSTVSSDPSPSSSA